jgi:hypothetical protein
METKETEEEERQREMLEMLDKIKDASNGPEHAKRRVSKLCMH